MIAGGSCNLKGGFGNNALALPGKPGGMTCSGGTGRPGGGGGSCKCQQGSSCCKPPKPSCNSTGQSPTGAQAPGKSCYPILFRHGAVSEEATDLDVSAREPRGNSAAPTIANSRPTTLLGGQWLTNCTEYKLLASGTYNIALVVDAGAKAVFTYSSGTYTAPTDSTLTPRPQCRRYVHTHEHVDWRRSASSMT